MTGETTSTTKEIRLGSVEGLKLRHLPGDVRILTGPVPEAKVRIDGDREAVDNTTVRQEGGEVTVAGKRTDRNVVTTSGIVINGRGNVTIVGGQNVVIDGNVVSGSNRSAKDPVLHTNVIVPKGTDLDVDDCLDVTADGLGGRLTADVQASDRLDVDSFNGATIDVGSSGRVMARHGKGGLRSESTSSGRSDVDGAFDSAAVTVESSGKFTFTGSIDELRGTAESSGKATLGGAFGAVKVAAETSGMFDFRNGTIGKLDATTQTSGSVRGCAPVAEVLRRRRDMTGGPITLGG